MDSPAPYHPYATAPAAAAAVAYAEPGLRPGSAPKLKKNRPGTPGEQGTPGRSRLNWPTGGPARASQGEERAAAL